MSIADTMATNGMKEVGYEYINLDGTCMRGHVPECVFSFASVLVSWWHAHAMQCWIMDDLSAIAYEYN